MTPTLCCSPPLSPPEPQRPARTPPAPSTPRSPLSSQPGPQHQAHPHRGAEALAGRLSFEFTHEKPQTWPVRWLPFSSCSPRTLCPAAAAPPAQAWLRGAPCADRCRPARCSLPASLTSSLISPGHAPGWPGWARVTHATVTARLCGLVFLLHTPAPVGTEGLCPLPAERPHASHSESSAG